MELESVLRKNLCRNPLRSPRRRTSMPKNAIALLKADHRKVEALFEEFELVGLKGGTWRRIPPPPPRAALRGRELRRRQAPAPRSRAPGSSRFRTSSRIFPFYETASLCGAAQLGRLTFHRQFKTVRRGCVLCNRPRAACRDRQRRSRQLQRCSRLPDNRARAEAREVFHGPSSAAM